MTLTYLLRFVHLLMDCFNEVVGMQCSVTGMVDLDCRLADH